MNERLSGSQAASRLEMRIWKPKAAESVRRWKVGTVTITKISEGVLESGLETPSDEEGFLCQASCDVLLAIDWLRPDFVTENGEIRRAIHTRVVETPTQRILVDSCVGNDKRRPQQPFWDQLGGPFLNSFSAAGFRREDIDTVVCTHLHVDHVGWNTMQVNGRWVPTFPNARYLFGRAEYEYCAGKARDGGRRFTASGGIPGGLCPAGFRRRTGRSGGSRSPDLRRSLAPADTRPYTRPHTRPCQCCGRSRRAGRDHHRDGLISQGARDLTIVNNNAGDGEVGLAALLKVGRVRKITCSFPRTANSQVFEDLYRRGWPAAHRVI